ncbi:MAG TPA: adenylosuccinate synthase [Candidatus Binatia bacterium]|nr:adenylosuccinate synthase [Candidatus Binatia bacterium]
MSSGKVDVVVGIQWGDEGKGRVVDLIAPEYDIVARFGGGDNAGHSIQVGDRRLAVRIIPSGVLVPNVDLFVGGGTVVNLETLGQELDVLVALGVDIGRVKISDRAHLVLPHHALVDRQLERARGSSAIGTTGRGIGPAYVDKVARIGVTVGDLLAPDVAAVKIRANIRASAPVLSGLSDAPKEEDEVRQTLALAERIVPHVVDGVAFVHEALERGARILAEGAQAAMLDIGFGTYPYVTSSHTIAGGACIGLGIGPRTIDRVIGVAKTYCTRVGSGPFPSELDGPIAERLRDRGHEYGTVTGRPRRVGWFDAVAARYARRVNGLTSVVLTKLDVLSGLERVGVVTAYGSDGQADVRWHDGWQQELEPHSHELGDLPVAALTYVDFLRSSLGVPIDFVSIGPERSAFVR